MESTEDLRDKSLPVGKEAVVEEIVNLEDYAHPNKQPPLSRSYRIRIDGELVKVETHCPTGEMLLSKVGKRPCAFELIEEFVHHENDVVEPGETVDLRKHGLKGFITAHKEIVTICINGDPYPIQRGERTVAEILAQVGQTPEGYILLEEKNGPPLPLPANLFVKICGCEVFHSQTQSGGSS